MQQETPRQWNVESKGMVGLTVLLILLALVLFSGMAHAAIEDVLYESGKISKEEWLKIKAEREKEEAEREKQIKEAVDRAITRDVKKKKVDRRGSLVGGFAPAVWTILAVWERRGW